MGSVNQPRLWRRCSLRVRLVGLGTAGLAVGLGIGGLILIAVLTTVIQRSIDNEARQTGRDVARLVDDGALPDPTPVAGGQIVQVVDAQHRVRSASVNADRLVPVLREPEIARARATGMLVVPDDRGGLSGPLRVVVVPAGPADDPQTVIVARSAADVRHSVAVVTVALIVAYPLLVTAMAVVGWRVAGAVLRPVEALRAGAEQITAGGVARPQAGAGSRVPVPPSRDEIHRLAVTLNRMLDRLATAQARQRAFVADAAHELRSPITSMRTQLEVARHLGVTGRGESGQLVDDLLVDVERLARLVDDLLLLARADEAVTLSRTAPVELAALATEVADRYAAARVPVTAAVWRPAWVAGDHGALVRVLTNLLDNAVRHAARRVVVSVAATGAYQVVSVVDDGRGIPAADRERVFDRFTRLDDARARDEGGSGLGLPIVRELVRRHGGTVRLSDASPGLRVDVRLPAAPAPDGSAPDGSAAGSIGKRS